MELPQNSESNGNPENKGYPKVAFTFYLPIESRK